MSPKAAARRDYKAGRAQVGKAKRGNRERGRITAIKPSKPHKPRSCSNPVSSCCSFETIVSSISNVPQGAIARLENVAARVHVHNEETKGAVEVSDVCESDAYWMDNYWSDKIRRRATTIGEICVKRGPPTLDDGAIFDMDL